MQNELHNELLHCLFQFKKLAQSFRPRVPPEEGDLNMASLWLLHHIREHPCDLSGEKIRRELCITKAAVSQMLGSLEKKGYLTREVNRDNRRCIILSLTGKGAAVLEKSRAETEARLAGIISRFGKANTRELITLVNRFSDITENAGP
ncbi:MAG: MarR family transcriptional regulator [Spirochaetaceae bacterium]|jgi:DNA-binding MarR family transcriptional regulator|nr:MarR family transcriptional regulator [Spirochaetaceae bacterium]